MKKRNTRLLITVSSLVLTGLLFAQGFWIWRSATIKEEQFSQQVSFALCRTAEALCSDHQTCQSLNGCCMMDNAKECSLQLNERQKARVDSLLRYYMDFYHVPVDYEFEIVRAATPVRNVSNDFRQTLNAPGLGNDYQLRLQLPDKSKFILAEMSTMFIISAVLTLALVTLFVLTLRLLAKDRRILRQTTDFVNNMVHEFRTPLTNITLATGMIARENISEEKRENIAGIIRSESDRLKLQVDRLLEMTALEEESTIKEKKKVDMHAVMEEQVENISMQAQQRGGQIEFFNHAIETNVMGDGLMLTAALRNLLDNAIKYSGGVPDITVTAKNENGRLLISVSDKGPGIDASQQQLIFEKFYRVTKGDTHDVKGFGLGLAFVKKVALLHHGDVTLKSEPGKGSTFTLSLPLAA